MFTNFKRILMAEADAATGAAAPVVVEASTAAEPQAQAAPPSPSVDVDAITMKVSDAVFAALRKSGAFDKSPKTKTDAPAQAAPSASEERTLLRGLDRAIAQLGFEPNAAQYARVERDLLADKPTDVTAYVKDYFPAPKASTPAAPAAVQAPAAKAAVPLNDKPASDRGSPASTVPLIERDLVTMSESDRNALIKEKGHGWYVKQLAAQLKGRPISLR